MSTRLRFLRLVAAAIALDGAALHAQSADTVAAGSDRHFSHQLTTAASRDAIWRRWTDVTGWAAWDRGLKSATLAGPFVTGSAGRLVPDKGPSAAFRLIEVSSPQRYTFRTKLPLAALDITRRFASDSGGRTRFVHEVQFRGTLGWFWARLYGPRYRRALPQVMRQLALLAESDSLPPSEQGR